MGVLLGGAEDGVTSGPFLFFMLSLCSEHHPSPEMERSAPPAPVNITHTGPRRLLPSTNAVAAVSLTTRGFPLHAVVPC